MNPVALINAMPGAVSQGLIWGIMAIGVYITYRVLDVSDLTVDGTLCTGGATFIMATMAGCNIPLALLLHFLPVLRRVLSPAFCTLPAASPLFWPVF